MSIFKKMQDLIATPDADILSLKNEETGEKMFENIGEFYELIEDFNDAVNKYAKHVNGQVIGNQISYRKSAGDKESLQEQITGLDEARTFAHNSAISHVRAINKICRQLGKDEICELDTDDRQAVNAFIFTYCIELYISGSKYLEEYSDFIQEDIKEVWHW